MVDDALSIVRRLSAVFEHLGIAYYVGGSVASIVHGEIRATNDVDFVAELRTEHARAIVERLGDAWYADEQTILDAVRSAGSFNLIDFQTMLKADVFVAGEERFAREQLSRRERQDLGSADAPIQAYVASAEDVVLQKLRWYKMGGSVSDRQWRDVLGVLKVQAERLDSAYMRRWAAELGISDLLERAIEDAGLGPAP